MPKRGEASGAPRSGTGILGLLLMLALTSMVVWPQDGPPGGHGGGRQLSSALAARGSPLEWRACPGGECAELPVPRDYDKPRGPTIDVALFRIPAVQHDQRIGSLLVNPGGPGVPGTAFVRDVGPAAPEALRNRFDIVGFDPRGTGGTLPIDCTESLDPLLDLDYSPDSKPERAALADAGRDFAAACERRSGEALRHIASQDTVRDMDRIRAALGDERLTYFGASYGTYLGALYAEYFPKRVRALVLDGPVDPALEAIELRKQQAVGFERALDAFLDDCAADSSCAFHSNGDPDGAYDELVARIDAAPIPGPDGRTLGPNEFDVGVASVLYGGEGGYEALASALAAAAQSDGGAILGEFDAYVERETDGTYSSILEAYFAISCRDLQGVAAREYKRLEDEFGEAAPRFGVPLLYELVMCTYWPVPAARPPGDVRGKGAPPILVVGTTGDPATPYTGAQSLTKRLTSGVLLTAEGQQHVAFLRNACVTEHVVSYLVDLDVPPTGSRCQA